jgi:C4-dicarboxylate-specific signal transduction histidine kinase
MMALCTYPLTGSTAAEILDVARTHQFAIARRDNGWEVVETSELKQAKSEIKRLNDELELRVTDRTRQLAAVNEEIRMEMVERQRAEEALHEAQVELARLTRALDMGELVAAIAHEVNQPLAAIVTNANFCLRQFATPAADTSKLREAISEIANDGTRASAVISRIRTLLRKGSSERVPLDVNQIIREVNVLLRGELTRNRVSLRTALDAGLPRVNGDRVQLQQVLINLVMNGIEAMRSPAHRPRELLIRSTPNSNHVLIQVQDSGEGLNPQQVEHIFEPFFTTKPEGIGMGLSISRSIVESHGGRLWAEPVPRGALFQFTLPTQ